jgi:cytochrome c
MIPAMPRLAHLLVPLLFTAISPAAPPADEFFRVETISEGFVDAMEIAVTPKGQVFVVERTGAVKLVDPASGKTTLVTIIPVEVKKGEFARECGLLGITVDPGFEKNRWVYLYYSVPKNPVHQLSRFTFDGTTLTLEKKLLQVPHDRENATCHEGGSLAFGPDGCLYLSTGDNTCPFKSNGSAPIDEGPNRKWYDAQRSAANTNDLRGKILRIKPTPGGSYTIPKGNLFPEKTPKTRPEIYVMGCRNPYRISIDPKTNDLYWGKVGPDAGRDSDRGPRGYDEINQARGPGNYGWPYFSGDNQPYADYDFVTKKLGKKFDPAAPVNTSVNNTGLTKLPPAQPAFWHYPHASACAGPVFYADLYPSGAPGLPRELDGCLIAYDWTKARLYAIKLDAKGNIEWNQPFLGKYRFVHPGDMEMGPRGELYLLEYGSAWYDGKDGKLKRITYSKDPVTIPVSPSDPRMKGLPKDHPGTKLISETTCLSCHQTRQPSIGPSYRDVAKKYAKDPKAFENLAHKILKGGLGVWGEQPMPPHPQHNIEETRQMVEAILKVK